MICQARTPIGVLPKSWEVKPIGERCGVANSSISYSSLTAISEDAKGDAIVFGVKVSDMNLYGNERRFRTANLVRNLPIADAKNRTVPSNALVFPKRGAAIATNKKRLTTTWTVLDPNLIAVIPGGNVSPEFLQFWFDTFDLKRVTDPGPTPQLNKKDIMPILFPIPPLPEQRRIAAVLSLVQRAIEKQERLIALSTELKKALMHKFFTEGTRGEPQKQTEIGPIPESWEIVELGSLVEKTENVNMKNEGGRRIEYVDVSGISREFLRINSATPCVLKDAPGRARKKVREGDVIFATVRPTLMRIAHVGPEYDDQVCSTAFCVLRGRHSCLDGAFIFYLVQTRTFIKRIASIQSGASYPAVTDNQVRAQLVQVPSFDEQQEIAGCIQAIDEKTWNHEQKRIALSDLFHTLLHQLMTAEIRVNDLDLAELGIEADEEPAEAV